MSFGRPRISVGTYVVTRTAVSEPINGRKQSGSTSTFTITANIQPAPGKILEILPEARRSGDIRLVFTDSELFVVRAGYEPDQITIPTLGIPGTPDNAEEGYFGGYLGGSGGGDPVPPEGELFEVLAVRPWLRHFEVLVARQVKP